MGINRDVWLGDEESGRERKEGKKKKRKETGTVSERDEESREREGIRD